MQTQTSPSAIETVGQLNEDHRKLRESVLPASAALPLAIVSNAADYDVDGIVCEVGGS